MKKLLTTKQVAVLRPIYERMRKSEREWEAALILLGLEDARIVGGNLEEDEPYLEIGES